MMELEKPEKGAESERERETTATIVKVESGEQPGPASSTT
jgi:hypothetical protein